MFSITIGVGIGVGFWICDGAGVDLVFTSEFPDGGTVWLLV